jgi:hypothetical protein
LSGCVGLVQPLDEQAGKNGGQGRNRTTDTRIFNPLLYQLSYLAKLIKPATSGRGFSILAYPVALRPRYRAKFSNLRCARWRNIAELGRQAAGY